MFHHHKGSVLSLLKSVRCSPIHKLDSTKLQTFRTSLTLSEKTREKDGGLITTPIYYANGHPHIGHLFTSILSDSLFLYYKHLKKHSDMIFSTGTDEHGSKVQRTAVKAYMESRNLKPEDVTDEAIVNQACVEFCERISKRFQTMMTDFEINYTHYLRTSATKEHIETVDRVWRELELKGDIYLGEYKGWYCTTDEAFTNDIEQVTIKNERGEEETITVNKSSGNRCEFVTEKNFKFRLSNYMARIEKWLEENPKAVKPKERYNELIEMVKKEKDRPADSLDLSISRTRDRVQWGIPVPGDSNHTIYVWLDALTNYLTAGSSMANEAMNWPPTVQVIGKDILKFHGIYWPAFLMALGKELPETILVHSYWLVNDVKMSKSLGNVVSPYDLLKETGVGHDLLRYYLLSEATLSTDSSFSMQRFPVKVNELADIFGNLLSRSFNTKFQETARDLRFRNLSFEIIGEQNPNQTKLELIQMLNELQEQVKSAYEEKCEIRFANLAACNALRKCNQLFDEVKPWNLVKSESTVDQLEELLFIVGETLRNCAIALYPVLPDKMMYALKFVSQDEPTLEDIGFCKKGTTLHVGSNPEILFKKIETPKDQPKNSSANRGRPKQQTQ